jgi:malonyl-CoA/methylmalonyl-CoA synthetase
MTAPLLALDAAEHGATALRFPGRSLTYGELRRVAAAVAARVDGAKRIAVWAEPAIEACVGVVGGLVAGVPVVPLNPRSGGAELRHVLADSAPDAILAAPRAELPDATDRIPVMRVSADPGAAGERPLPAEPEPDATALIIYTSGTTGSPKGVVLSRRAIASNLDALAGVWRWSPADVLAHGLPLFHVHGLVLGVLGPLRLGGAVHHIGRFSVEGIVEAFRGDATMLFGVPTMYRRLAEAGEEAGVGSALARARILVSGSAALPAAEHARLERLTGKVVLERYGLTETIIDTAVPCDAPPRPGYVGPALPGVELRLTSDAGEPLHASDDETIGEVEVRGPNLFDGYLNRPDATAEAFRDGWFRTGDLATRAEDGYLRIVGRQATDLIKSGGYKIGAGEIEWALREHAAVEDAAVTAEPDPDLGERVVAWVVKRDGAGVEEGALSDHVAALLAPHKRPRVVHFVPELPRNELGKVQKARLGAA